MPASRSTPFRAPADPRGAPGVHRIPVPLGMSSVDGGPLASVRRRTREVTLETIYLRCEECGALDNLRRAAGLLPGDPVADFQGEFFADSDVHKWLEAACWHLAEEPDDPALRARIDATVELLAAAQQPDGYLNSFFMGERAAERWQNITDRHEMYCGGHLLQAAVAHLRATGERTLTDVAIRFADHVWTVFGPGRRPGADGHPGYETALVELSRATGERRFLEQARWFVEQHGRTPAAIGGREYHLDHAPLTEQPEVTGHAVRALYLYTGAADVVAEEPDAGLMAALERLWRNFADRKRYVTGGAGARHDYEAFGAEWELGDERAYAESCASVAHFQFAWRMFLLTGRGEFRDAMEQVLWNGLLSGLGDNGEDFFYVNPLADNGRHRRSPWFGTACCPPNLARLVGSLPAYTYATSGDTLWTLLLTEGTVRTELAGGTLELRISTRYPLDGEVVVEVLRAPEEPCGVALPIPDWADGASWSLDGADLPFEEADGFALLHRRWQAGDKLTGGYRMPVRPLAAHPRVRAAHGRIALTRGPLVFCLEQADHEAADVRDIAVTADGPWTADPRPDLLGGTVTLRGTGWAPPAEAADGPLYRPAGEPWPEARPVDVTAVPYYLWANREPGPMQVWLPLADGVETASSR
ncbi:beta-L-arabinofuranosidase domain-containing protein [Streptomyces sp. NPDC049881]|uniref:glycoside hydrolase family 127 protein n=1 Tax=Streptomyces sp. NPDC049881 TaxID=3155778 RepID=UPI00342B06FF